MPYLMPYIRIGLSGGMVPTREAGACTSPWKPHDRTKRTSHLSSCAGSGKMNINDVCGGQTPLLDPQKEGTKMSAGRDPMSSSHCPPNNSIQTWLQNRTPVSIRGTPHQKAVNVPPWRASKNSQGERNKLNVRRSCPKYCTASELSLARL